MECIILDFLDSSGKLPQKSGLNWGSSFGHTVVNDAYIPIRQEALSSGIIPERGVEDLVYNIGFDDGKFIEMRFEGSQYYNGKSYPKQLSSHGEKVILGTYLRKRLGGIYGRVIRKDDLIRYGRTDIKLKLVDGNYYLDFSVNE